MRVCTTLPELRRALEAWRVRDRAVGLVPTMGNLHAGHLRLVARCRALAERSVVSLFVNPAQFGPGEDFEAYPRTPEADLATLESVGCDLVWMPDMRIMYPGGLDDTTRLRAPPSLAGQLCGAGRPGHFDGVVTVVARLFNQVMPAIAVFGEKDYQQLLIIRRLVADLSFPTGVEAVPTEREADGLAMSSRNAYLTAEERAVAPALYRVLRGTAGALDGQTDHGELERAGMEALAEAGFEPEYLAIRRASDLSPARPGTPGLRLLAAARLGRTRLIDNCAP